ncbi:hypothetical protein DENSPDRAFT_743927, partial [Dentipellis sp. KUC8613]
LHGHFLIWLEGGMNPSDVHKRMKEDDSFKRRYFRFYESVSMHHLPDAKPPNFDATRYEPRVELPPVPPVPDSDGRLPQDILNEWDDVMRTEIYMCGETLQRHTCRAVCHKYGNDNRCRFLFPHETVEASYFDPESNTVALLCRDPTINWFNPYILVFCRHNHDIRCILSGKSAKAAMFYITDYITKMDMKTNQML